MKLHLLFCIFATPVSALACGPFFYPAPPSLDHYPERLPVKTMRELLRETLRPPADAATFEQVVEETRTIAGNLTVKPREKSRQAIERTLTRNRVGDYRKRVANCLYDFRDLLLGSTDTPTDEIQKYAAWRVDAMDWDDGFFDALPATDSYTFTAEELAAQRRAWKDHLDNTAADLSAEAGKASAVLKPHWLVQAGAWQFKHGCFEEAARLFAQVIAESPKHPRAEVAQLMLARVRIEEWRTTKHAVDSHDKTDQDKLESQFEAARQSLDAYVAAFPHGRFVPDIPGWRGGLARENGDLTGAISSFLEQMDFVEHPEIGRGAVRECEACLDSLEVTTVEDETALNGPGSALPLDAIARRPVAALAVVYHFLDAESRHDFNDLLERVDSMSDEDVTDRILPPVLRLRRAGRKILPALAEAVAKQKESYGAAGWRPKYLAILAWAASECGEQDQAIRLCDLAGPAIDRSDDLLFVRAVALQRADRLDQAIAAFRNLRDKYPDSPLSAETRYRIATALRDKHESGFALVEMARIEMVGTFSQRARWHRAPEETAEPGAVPDLHLASETAQWVDTLLQFGPLPELERALLLPDLEPEIAARIKPILRMRYLAQEDFAAAGRFAEPEPAEPVEPVESWRGSDYPVELKGDAWHKTTEELRQLKQELNETAPPGARARKLFELAEAWSSVRGRLTLPSLAEEDQLNGSSYERWALRYRDARVAGFSSTATEELEQRDELRHAYRYYLEAAKTAVDKPLVARALWRANDALRRMAELSPWSATRAFETNASATSRQLHDLLLRDCPASAEARRLSVWWSFPPPPELHWMPSNQSYNMEVAIADAFEGKTYRFDESPQWQNNDTFAQRLAEVAAKAGTWDTAKLLDALAAIRSDFLPVYASPRGSWLINHLDDLTLFLHEPGLTPSVRSKYFAARLSNRPPDLGDPEMRPWRDYLTFLALVREPPIGEDPSTGWPLFRPMSERMREFLAQFPKSRKREAALARLAVAEVRESRGPCGVSRLPWPTAPIIGGYDTIGVAHEPTPGHQRVFAGLDVYDREFPNGRYAAEIKLWRGVAAVDARDWNSAINLLVATLDDQTKPDLHLDAALNLAGVFMRLLDDPPNARPEIIAAIAGNPSARKRLDQFAHSDTIGARLACLDGYLAEQFRLHESHRQR